MLWPFWVFKNFPDGGLAVFKLGFETRASWPVFFVFFSGRGGFDGRFKIRLPFKLMSIVPWPFITG